MPTVNPMAGFQALSFLAAVATADLPLTFAFRRMCRFFATNSACWVAKKANLSSRMSVVSPRAKRFG